LPKPKPDEVIRHELVMGRSERELLETITTAYTVNRVLSPFATLLSTTAGLLLVATLLLQYLEKYLPEGWPDMSDNQLADWFETENLVVGGIGATAGGILGFLFGGGPIGAAAGAAVGGFGGGLYQEQAEAAQEGGAPKLLSYTQFGQIYGAARRLNNLIQQLEKDESNGG